ncbi:MULTISPECIES: protein-L-isoaspartate O-methyltransferase [unclassified Iodidimonas]|uniref:protein-L-isoaspartate O-methyltransferase family protein n=1 Tax=unclassified Iodidimonas TaxID=2626145 RepID=UPI0024824B7C|nr:MULTISPECIES: protein-L-isoaspartate O-methyltransferase [unclassified Iodidimonas]
MRQSAFPAASQGDMSKAARLAMIAGQIRPNRVSDDQVLAAIEAIPRESFVPKALRGVAYVDEDLEIADGRYLMEPMVFARMIMEAEIRPDDVVLDVGAATGYSTAVLSKLAETVVALEEDDDLLTRAGAKLAELGCDNAVVIKGDLTAGAPEQGPFDVIVLNGAVEYIPDALIGQLADGGRLVCVHMHDGLSRAHVMVKSGDAVGGRDVFDAFTPLLPGFSKAPAFRFSSDEIG